MNSDVGIEFSGPVFSGMAAKDLADMAAECQVEVAKFAEDVWRSYMDASFRTQSGGGYQSHVNIARRDKDLVVNDAGVIYGFWLEGIGSRNYPVTKFKGYFARRRAVAYVNGQVDDICQPIVDKALEKINHG